MFPLQSPSKIWVQKAQMDFADYYNFISNQFFWSYLEWEIEALFPGLLLAVYSLDKVQ